MRGSIAVVHKLFPLDVDGVLGGAETVTVETAIGLKKAGWKVYVFGWIVGGNKVKDGVHFIDYGEDYRLYDVFQRYKDINFEACLSVQAYSIKTLLSFENIKRHFLIPQDMSFVDHQVGTYFINKYVDGVICISDFQKKAYLEWGIEKEKLVKLPYGIDANIYRPISERKINRIMFAGATIKEKGIDILVEAFKIVKRQIPNLELHIYGDSSLWGRKDSITESKEGIFLHGKVKKEEIIKAYSESALCIIPTVPELYKESLPRSSLEAQACGCPVIGTRSGGLPETFINGETGFLVDHLSAQSLADTILKALSDKEKLKPMSERCTDHIRENFLWEKQIKRLEEYILSVNPSEPKINNLTYKDLKILYYTEVPLMPSKTSSCNRNYQIIKILLEKGVHIVYTHGFFINKTEKEIEELSLSYKNFEVKLPIYKNLKLMDEVDLLWITEAWDLDRLRKALSLARRAKLAYGIPVVFDAMDSVYKHMLSAKSAGKDISDDELKAIFSIEKELYELSDIAIFVSEEDREFAVKELGLSRDRSLIISNIHYPEEILANERRKSLCFIGGVLNFNNLLAIKYFLNEVYHHILKKDKNIEFYVIGDRTDELKLEDLVRDRELLELYRGKVHFVGWVKDINREVKKHSLSVAPLVSGSGIKGKILNSLECGVPVVTTPKGVEGFDELESSGILVAERPEEFADLVVKVMNDNSLRERLSKMGLKYVRERFSVEKASRTLDSLTPLMREAIKKAHSNYKAYSYRVFSDYKLFMPDGYIKTDDTERVIRAVLGLTGDKFQVISFNFTDVYVTESSIRPSFFYDPPESYRWVPALIKKDLPKNFLSKSETNHLHLDLILCYKELRMWGLKGNLISFGLKHKMFFRKYPLLERMAKKIYRILQRI